MRRSTSVLFLILAAGIVNAQVTPNAPVAPVNGSTVSAVLPEQTNQQTGVLLPNPPAPKCEVGISKYTINSINYNQQRQPTASPVPSAVLGRLELDIANLVEASANVTVVRIETPVGVVLTNLTGGAAERIYSGFNSTAAINVTLTTPLAPAADHNTSKITTAVIASSPDFAPKRIYVNGDLCALGFTPDVTARKDVEVTPQNSALGSNNFTSFAVNGAVGVSGTRIIGVDGNPLRLKGVNWFGFETPARGVDGFYAGDTTLVGDLATVAYRIQLLGFNAIRLPFSFLNLYQAETNSYTKQCSISSEQDIRNNVIDPRDAPNIPADAQPPSIVAPPSTYGKSGVCNDYWPNDSILTRFLYTVGYFARQGIYVLIDNHSNSDPTVINNPDTWVAQWTSLMQAINEDSVARAYTMVDVLNEPDAVFLQWEQMGPLYLRAMDAIYQVNPNTLFFIEGMGKQGDVQMCWGDGFVTDPNYVNQPGFSNPRPFFDTLLTKPYLGNTVISPHYYGPSVSQNRDRYTGTALAARASLSFGYLATTGYGGHKFPIVIGETGSQFTDQRDLAFYNDLSLYLRNLDYMNDGLHDVIGDLFWWSWNANSGDTGGIVDDTWVNVRWDKVEYLETAIGLTPWSLLAANGASNPSPPPAQVSSPPPPPAQVSSPPPPPAQVSSPPPPPEQVSSPPPPPAQVSSPPPPAEPVTPSSPSPPPPAQPVTPSSPSPPPAGPVTPSSPSPPPPAEPVTPSSPTPPPPSPVNPGGGGTCAAAVRVEAQWMNDGLDYAVINFFLSSTSSQSINTPYSIVLRNPGYIGVLSSWNWEASAGNGQVSGQSDGNAMWETMAANNGNSVNLGFIVQSNNGMSQEDLRPNSFAVNGADCSLSFI